MGTSTSRTWRAFTSLATTGLVVAVLAGCGGSGGEQTTAELSTLDSIIPSAPSEIPDFESAAEPVDAALPTPPTDPVDAVESYLVAERSGEIERSYAALSSVARQSAGSVADWAETRFERPTIVDFEIDPAASGSPAGASAVIVQGEVTLEPRLDEVSGFVPQRADVEWKVVAEDGGWRVDLVDSSFSPILPDDRGATVAAEHWAAGRQQCRVDGEYEGSLLGSPALGDELCGLEGDVVAGPASPLDDAMSTQVVAAFGPDAIGWARSVPLSGAAELSVVTAPYGDRWVVVGVAP